MTHDEINERFYELYGSDQRYYSLRDVHNKTDLDGERPRIFRISSNRSGGKTTQVLLYCWFMFDQMGEQFVLMLRNKGTVDGVAQRMSEAARIMGKHERLYTIWPTKFYAALLYGDDPETSQIIGFAFSIKDANELKNYSASFTNVERALFDEFQAEDGIYLNDEVQLAMSCLTSICRGGGEQSREIDLYLVGNEITDLNPWDIHFQTYKRRRKETRFLRGHGWIAEFAHLESAAEAIRQNRLLAALDSGGYMQFATGEKKLVRDEAFISGPPEGRSRYIATIIYNDKPYGLRYYPGSGIVYASKKPDPSAHYKLAFRAADMEGNRMLLDRNLFVYRDLRDSYKSGRLYFDDYETKMTFYDILAVNLYK